MTDDAPRVRACLLDLLGKRSPEASICPSEVARALVAPDEDWRLLMEPVRAEAQRLALAGMLVITQGVRQLPPEGPFNGPIRLRRGPKF